MDQQHTQTNQSEQNNPQAVQENLNEESLSEEQTPEALLQQVSDLTLKNEQLLRAYAEVENMRRRAEENVKKAREYALEGFAPTLLPVMDSLQTALIQITQVGEIDKIKEGIEITQKQLQNAFERAKITEINPAAGDKLDPLLHQTMGAVPSEYPNNHVVQVLQKGYQLADRVLRPALVMVSQSNA
jgi:molecular chaperone GrpE